MKRVFTATFLLIFFIQFLSAQQAEFTREMVMNMKYISSPKISPDGRWAAYTKLLPPPADEGKKSYYRELWVMHLSSGEAVRYATKEEPASGYVWSDDGEYLYFRATRKKYHDKSQVYRMRLNGGFPERITEHATGVGAFALSPDGRSIAFVAKREKSDEEKRRLKNGEDWIINENDFDWQYLYVQDLKSKKTVRVSPDKKYVLSFVWEPDGKHLIYQAADRGMTDDSYMFRDIYRTLSTEDKSSLLCAHDGKLGKMEVSPNGKYLAFLGGVDISDPGEQSILITEIGSGNWTNLTEGFEGSVFSFQWKNDETLIATAAVFNHTEVFEISVASGERKQLFGDGPIMSGTDLATDGDHFVCLANTYNHPNELFSGKLSDKSLRRMTETNPEFKRVKFLPAEDFNWKARDGKMISGVVYKPKKFRKNGHAPLIVLVHGGPEGVRFRGWNNSYSQWPQLMAQKGYVVFIPNYRGSVGRGVEFSKAYHNDMMGVDFNDVLDGIDALIAQKWVNPKKVGITGGSYGGYMTAWAATRYSERFAAGVMFVGISNQISKIGVTDTPEENSLVHWNSYNWDDNFKLAWDRSPLKYIDKHHTPLLIAHGDKDKRVPTGQSHEMYRALKHKNQAPVELIIYPGEGHGNRKRAHREHYMRRAIEWLDRYLLNEEPNY